MISIDSALFTDLKARVKEAFHKAYVAPEYVSQPPKFPAVYIEETDNVTKRSTRTNASTEDFADVTLDFEVYSNRNQGKKAECRAIANLLDERLIELGLRRVFLNPLPNMNDATIYRMRGRYQYTVSKDNIIYRR